MVEHIDDADAWGRGLPPEHQRRRGGIHRREGKILFGLAAIKGVGHKAVDALVKARKQAGRSADSTTCSEASAAGSVNQACVEALIEAGGSTRWVARAASWLAVLPRAAQAGQATAQEDRRRGQKSLLMFSLRRGQSGRRPRQRAQAGHQPPRRRAGRLPDVPELPDVQRLAEEKKVLGFYMSSHPLTRHAAMLQTLATHRVDELGEIDVNVSNDYKPRKRKSFLAA